MNKLLHIKNSVSCRLCEIKWREQFILMLTLIIFWPVGLYQMWKNSKWNIVVKVIVTVFIIFGVLSLTQRRK